VDAVPVDARLFCLTYIGLEIRLWPDIIPGRVTIWEAAAPPAAQMFVLIGIMITVPAVLAYTGWAYWVFRGKTGVEGYH
jgi:cytochrome bd ubiquinol oxidase subunit II